MVVIFHTTTWPGYANPVAVDRAGSEDPCDVYQDESYLYIGQVTGFECRGLVGYDLAPIPAGAQLTDAPLL